MSIALLNDHNSIVRLLEDCKEKPSDAESQRHENCFDETQYFALKIGIETDQHRDN